MDAYGDIRLSTPMVYAQHCGRPCATWPAMAMTVLAVYSESHVALRCAGLLARPSLRCTKTSQRRLRCTKSSGSCTPQEYPCHEVHRKSILGTIWYTAGTCVFATPRCMTRSRHHEIQLAVGFSSKRLAYYKCDERKSAVQSIFIRELRVAKGTATEQGMDEEVRDG